MSDITLCKTTDKCPFENLCLRKSAKPNKVYQSYAVFDRVWDNCFLPKNPATGWKKATQIWKKEEDKQVWRLRCMAHPDYQALRKPRVRCIQCWRMWMGKKLVGV